MLPILLRAGPITIYSFGVALFFSLIAGSFLVWKQARQRGLAEEKIFDTFLLTIFLGLIGARIGFCFTHWSTFGADLSRIILFTHYPGLSFAWGFVAGILTAYIAGGFLTLDIFAIAFSWALLIGLTGGFLDGSLKAWWLIIVCAILALLLSVFNHKVRSTANLAALARRPGLSFSAYLIFLASGLLILQKDPVYLGLLVTTIILFMVKFPKSVLTQIKDYLEAKYKDSEARIKELKKEDPFEGEERLLDRASDDTEATAKAGHERVAAMQQQMNMILVQTRKALTKIKIGKYGICENCGKMIDTDRLAAMPTATLCLNCEKKRERK